MISQVSKNKTKSFFAKAEIYVRGVLMEEERNLEKISETMDSNYHQMQHFITESNWSARRLMDQVAREVSETLPKKKLTALIIDESGWSKKGDKSVGVGRQYCGNLGKVANCFRGRLQMIPPIGKKCYHQPYHKRNK